MGLAPNRSACDNREEQRSGHTMPRRGERIFGIPATAVMWVVALAIAGISTTTVLAPSVERSTNASGIPIDRLRAHVDAIGRAPHPIGSDEIGRVREYLVTELDAVGLVPELQTVSAPDWFGAPGDTVEVTNVMARVPGTGDGTAILLMAHYDTVPVTPGANDNSTAVAALIEAGRALTAAPPGLNDVIVLFTDGEEPNPRFGASAFAEHPWFGDVALAVNLEAIGESGPAMLVEASGNVGELLDGLASVDSPVAFSFLTKTADLIGGASTDFDVIRDAGVPGLNFAYLRGSSIYHTEADDLSRVNEEGMAHDAAIVVGLARHFGNLDLAALEGADDPVFFAIPLRIVVRHPATWVTGVAIAVVVLLVVGLAHTVSRRPFPWRPLVRGMGLAMAGALAAATIGTVLWMVIAALRPTMGVIEGYVYLALLLAVAGGCWALAWGRAGATRADVVGGMIVVWAALAAVAGTTIPLIGYLFAWPALAATVALAMRSFVPSSIGWRLTAMVIVVVPTTILLTPAIDTFFLFATPRPGSPDSQLPSAVAAAVLLAYLVIGLVASAADPHATASFED